MQTYNLIYMAERSLYYWSRMYLDFVPLRPGQGYHALKPAIAINILRHTYLPQAAMHAAYGIYDIENQHRLTDHLEIHFLELSKWKHKPVHEMTKVERWGAILLNRLDKAEKEELAMENAVYGDVFDAADRFAMSEEDYQKYLYRESAILDYNTNFIEERELAREEGELSLVQRLLAVNTPIEYIEKATGWSKDRILATKK